MFVMAEALFMTLEKRRMARTTKGYIGLVPKDAQPGDCIVLLMGVSVPVVLRPSGQRWKLMGESYVEGIMNGELWKKEDASEICIE
jgi:hypothetical protein